MSEEASVRRRIVQGLMEHLNEPALQQALQHWDANYARGNRSSLQKFVFEIAAEGDLRQKRSGILLSLVNAMNLPESDVKVLAPQRKVSAISDDPRTAVASKAFVLLMTTLMATVNAMLQHTLRLDISASLSNPRLPREVVEALLGWLNDGRPLRLPPQSPTVLRALVNHTYVLLCERVGPVEADKLLAKTVNDAQQRHPQLADGLNHLL